MPSTKYCRHPDHFSGLEKTQFDCYKKGPDLRIRGFFYDLMIQPTLLGKRCAHAPPFQGRINPSVGLDCRHPGDRHPSKGAHEHIIGTGVQVDFIIDGMCKIENQQ